MSVMEVIRAVDMIMQGALLDGGLSGCLTNLALLFLDLSSLKRDLSSVK